MPPETPDRADIDGIVRGGLVQFLARREAVLGKAARHVPVIGRIAQRHGDDPLAGGGLRGEGADTVQHVADGPAAFE